MRMLFNIGVGAVAFAGLFVAFVAAGTYDNAVDRVRSGVRRIGALIPFGDLPEM